MDQQLENWRRDWSREINRPRLTARYVIGPLMDGELEGMKYEYQSPAGPQTAYWLEYNPNPTDKVGLVLRAGQGSGLADRQHAHVLTSMGARVPIDQAVRLLRLVEVVKARGEDYVVQPGDGEKHRFGYYQ